MKNEIFSPQIIQQIKDRCNLPEVIGSYVSLDRNLRALCPFHQEKTPSFTVHRHKNYWHCFGCGRTGDVFTFVRLMEKLSFPDAVRTLADRAGVILPQSERYKNYLARKWEKKKGKLDKLVLFKEFLKEAKVRRADELLEERRRLPSKTQWGSWCAQDYLKEQIIDYNFDLLDQKIKKIENDLESGRREIINE